MNPTSLALREENGRVISGARAFFRMMSLMLHPRSMQNARVFEQLPRMFTGAGENDLEMLRSYTNQAARAEVGGITAGRVFLRLLSWRQATDPKFSQERAIYLVSKIAHREKNNLRTTYHGAKVPPTTKYIKDFWHEYRKPIILWGALCLLAENEIGLDEHDHSANFQRLAGAAITLGSLAELLAPEIIRESWRVPSDILITTPDFALPSPSDIEKDFMKEFVPLER